MLIREIMSLCPAECTEDTPIAEVYELITGGGNGFVVVVDSTSHRVPIGIVNLRSICDQLIVRGRNPKDLLAGSVIDTRIRRVPDSIAIENCSYVISGAHEPLVVVNDKRELCGVLDRARLASALTRSDMNRVSPASSEIPSFGWAT
jgi:CBS-domain-containing membrane protein